jgi:ribosomal protein S18 acetylase RimI-like enzyme
VWVIDRESGTPAALGIAELDESVPEASLEWIQVLPAYRRLGIASALICELQRRVEGLVAFTTAAGRLDNATHPEEVYRRCGFEGQDRFWVLRKVQG